MSPPPPSAMPNAWPDSVTEIVPGALYAVGARLDESRPVPWLPRGGRGDLPMQAYAFRSEDKFVLIDGGLSVHRAALSAGLTALAKGARERLMMITRRDTDTIITMPWMLRDLGIEKIFLGGGDQGPLAFFEVLERAEAEARMYVVSRSVPTGWLTPGSSMRVGPFRLEYARTPIRVLATNWIYEASTKTLFTSDCFAFLRCPSEETPLVARPAPRDISADRLIDFLDVKFDWLRAIDTRAVAKDFDAIFEGREIDRICPAYGRVIEGHDNVALLRANTLEALARMAKLPRRSLIEGFDWSCCEAP